jgi:Zn ribbon nucleic-acid-binding protein
MQSFRNRVIAGRPPCPECGMNMMTVGGFALDRKRQTFECFRCGHIDRPTGKFSEAAE